MHLFSALVGGTARRSAECATCHSAIHGALLSYAYAAFVNRRRASEGRGLTIAARELESGEFALSPPALSLEQNGDSARQWRRDRPWVSRGHGITG